MPKPDLQYRKKIIEVALPLEVINKESAHEKMPGIGAHPRGIHHWWARRPLVACRATIFASLVDDPSAWPELFLTEEEQIRERLRLFKIIEDLVAWSNSNDDEIILKAQTEIARSIARNNNHKMPTGKGQIRKYIAENAPPVLDPFSGMGSIPLEAQRLGLMANASDLNPVSVLITKSLIEFPPRFAGKPPINPSSRVQKQLDGQWTGAKGLAEDVRYYAKIMNMEGSKRFGNLYPKVRITEDLAKSRPDLKKYLGKELKVIAYIWARTVASSNPAVKGVHVPLVKTFWLSRKKGREVWISPIVDKNNNRFKFNVQTGNPDTVLRESIGMGTKISKRARAKFRCLLGGEPIPREWVHGEFQAKRNSRVLMAIVVEGNRERLYIPPIDSHREIADSAIPKWYPEEEMSTETPNLVSGRGYGIKYWHELFTSRQLVALTTYSDLIKEIHPKILADANEVAIFPHDTRKLFEGGTGAEAYADAIATYLAFIIDRCSDFNNSHARWVPKNEKVMNLFARQAIPMVWDYAEANIIEDVVGGFPTCAEYISDCIEILPKANLPGRVQQIDATANYKLHPLPLISTDPPYYDNIGYADLSDFFYIWLRKSLGKIYPSIFATLLTPKKQELIASACRHGGSKEVAMSFFEEELGRAFSRMFELENPNFPMTVFYAFKQTETEEDDDDDDESTSTTVSTGWETMLNGLIKAGFSIQGTWPMRSEQSERIIAAGTNALASCIVLVCRPRPANSPLATRREFISALKLELPTALKLLQQSSIAPVDLAQAAIGPGMGVFTRYIKVMESDGSPMTVRTALALINQTLDEVLAEQEGEFDPDTRWAIAWFDQFGMNEGPFGTAETLSRAKNTAINALVDDGLITARGGKVKLVSRNELPEGWDPAADRRLTAWESTLNTASHTGA
jgi:putative DNA methylase